MAQIKIQDTIGLTTRKGKFNKQLWNAVEGDEDIDLHINSPGGSVYHGVNMYNNIRMALSKGATINAYNTGMAASMGSMLFGAVPRENRYMAESSVLMVHNPRGIAFGDENEMRKEKEMLEKIGDISATAYARATGTTKGYMKALMDKTTWYNPEDAKKEGFAGNIVDGFEDVDRVEAASSMKSSFDNMPSNCAVSLCFDGETTNIEGNQNDLTKTSKSQIRDRIWKSCSRN